MFEMPGHAPGIFRLPSVMFALPQKEVIAGTTLPCLMKKLSPPGNAASHLEIAALHLTFGSPNFSE
jgi:hypothetical protein